MLCRENGEWALCPFKVTYKQHGEILERYTDDKQWWIDFAAKWDHTEVIVIEDAVCTEEQKARLEEVKDVAEGFEYYASRYVENGTFPNELDAEERMKDHPLKNLQLQKENEKQGQTLTDTEIGSMEQGQQLTEVELRLLELEVKG